MCIVDVTEMIRIFSVKAIHLNEPFILNGLYANDLSLVTVASARQLIRSKPVRIRVTLLCFSLGKRFKPLSP